MLAAINGLRLKDEVESMLATQMVAANHAAMDLFRRVGQSEYLESMTAYGNLAIKFLRTFNAQLEALQHYRGKGQQKIVVERVNVGEGGQAIVGHVQHRGPGGEGRQGAGSAENTEDQSHAKHQADAPKPALRREDETGNPMPSAGGER
jgi:hypothetical protein